MPASQSNSRLRFAAITAALALLAMLGLAGPAAATVTSSIQAGTNRMTISSDADDTINVTCNNGVVTVSGDDPFVACSGVESFLVVGGPGANPINLSGVRSSEFTALRSTDLQGGGGDDTITGTALSETLQGNEGDDRLIGAAGNDVLFGGDGSDAAAWDEGDGSDRIEGDEGSDSVLVGGNGAAGDVFTAAPVGTRVRLERRNLAPFSLDIGSARVLINGGGGDDVMSAAPALTQPLVLRGEEGNDSLTGGDGEDTLQGGEGNDRLVGRRAQDFISAGDGDDVMVWNDDDGADDVEGGGGVDTMEVNGDPDGDDEFIIEPTNCPTLPACSVRFRVPSGLDIAFSERLLVNGGGGNDRIAGSKLMPATMKFEFRGEDGNDTLGGTDRVDLLSGGRGADSIDSVDGAGDNVECGSGTDRARVDDRDRPRRCERVDGGDERVRIARRAKIAGGVATVKLRCVATRRCRGTVLLRYRGKSLGTRRFSATRRRAKVVRVRLNRRGRRLARRVRSRGLRVAAQTRARDAAGNGWSTTSRIRLLRS